MFQSFIKSKQSFTLVFCLPPHYRDDSWRKFTNRAIFKRETMDNSGSRTHTHILLGFVWSDVVKQTWCIGCT